MLKICTVLEHIHLCISLLYSEIFQKIVLYKLLLIASVIFFNFISYSIIIATIKIFHNGKYK